MNLPLEGHKCFVNIGDKNYSVRVYGGEHQIQHRGKWMNGDAFLDALLEDGNKRDIMELAELGKLIIDAK